MKPEAHRPATNHCFDMRPQLLHALPKPFSLLRHAHIDALPHGHIILDLHEATVACSYTYQADVVLANLLSFANRAWNLEVRELLPLSWSIKQGVPDLPSSLVSLLRCTGPPAFI